VSANRRFRVGLAAALLQPCAVCGSDESHVAAVFIPDAEFNRRLGARPGKTRYVFYSLCDSCVELADVVERVEEGMLAHFGGLS
jgi:hypothetical protein